jgi:hypothetical protein
VIGPLLTAAASTFAAQGLRKAVVEARRQAIVLAAGTVAMTMGAVCLTGAAFFALAEHIGPAAALGIIGGVYFLAGGLFFLLRRRSS